jgi:hypothetical protein
VITLTIDSQAGRAEASAVLASMRQGFRFIYTHSTISCSSSSPNGRRTQARDAKEKITFSACAETIRFPRTGHGIETPEPFPLCMGFPPRIPVAGIPPLLLVCVYLFPPAETDSTITL